MGYREDWFKDNKSNYGWYTCVKCGKKLRKGDVDIDHIIPQNRGGGSNRNNLQCLCKHCNRSKKDHMGLDTVKDYANNVSKNVKKDVKKMFNGLFKI